MGIRVAIPVKVDVFVLPAFGGPREGSRSLRAGIDDTAIFACPPRGRLTAPGFGRRFLGRWFTTGTDGRSCELLGSPHATR